MVEDVATNPRAIGLLYAGSSTDAIANPIDQVRASSARPWSASRSSPFYNSVPVRRQANGCFVALLLFLSFQFGNTGLWPVRQRVCNPLRQLIDTLTLAEDSGVQLRWAHRQKCLCS